MFEETGLTLIVGDFTLLSGKPVRALLPAVEYQLVYMFLASVLVPNVNTNMRTYAKVEHAVTAPSTVYPDGTFVLPATIDKDDMSLTSSKNGLARKT
jgi:hypothetical protein